MKTKIFSIFISVCAHSLAMDDGTLNGETFYTDFLDKREAADIQDDNLSAVHLATKLAQIKKTCLQKCEDQKSHCQASANCSIKLIETLADDYLADCDWEKKDDRDSIRLINLKYNQSEYTLNISNLFFNLLFPFPIMAINLISKTILRALRSQEKKEFERKIAYTKIKEIFLMRVKNYLKIPTEKNWLGTVSTLRTVENSAFCEAKKKTNDMSTIEILGKD